MLNFLLLVVVAVIAGLVLLSVEYGIIQNEEQSSIAANPTSETHSINDQPPVISLETEVQPVISDHKPESIRIREVLPIALQISFSYKRDSALEMLVNEALEVNDLLLAVEITSSISMPFKRNEAYIQIVDQALLKSNFKSAGIAANKISMTFKKDVQIQKILKARMEDN